MQKKRGFTLIELLVVIAIIALLLSILLPGLKAAKKQAEAIVCRSSEHQWGIAVLMYTHDNNNNFWVENNVWLLGGTQGDWMKMLSSFYGDMDEFRVCPSADTPNTSTGGIGTTFHQWGPGQIMIDHRFGTDVNKNYGSYGTNLWINAVTSANPGWKGRPERQWQTTLVKGNTASIPILADCVWFGTNPVTLAEGRGGMPTPTRDFWETLSPLVPGNWDMDMARVCIDRHNKGINVTFMDGSTGKVLLKDLWSLTWHKNFEHVYDVQIPWLK